MPVLAPQTDLFSLPDGLHYLNGAYMSPLLRSVEAAGLAGMRRRRDPTSITTPDFFTEADRVRGLFARLVQAADPEAASRHVALVPAVSYAMATVAQNLHPEAGQTLVVLGGQFPSHVYPWRRLGAETGAEVVTVDPPSPLGTPGRGETWNARLLDAIDGRTALVAVPNVHWADGTVFDLEAVGARAREVGAALVVDGTQSVGALPFDLEAVRPDALVCAGYKWLMGPYGMGVTVVGERFLDGRPLEETWIARAGAEDFAGLTDYEDAYAPGAVRFDVGERSNGILLPMLAAGLEQLLAWGVPEIQATCARLGNAIVEGACDLGYGAEAAAYRAGHLFGLAPPRGVDTEAVRQALAARNVAVSVRGEAVRVSPSVYNTEADAAALLGALTEAAA
ncbi:MAG: aminotransferase class V-fold PLP-dependent enzyme [Bacteroidota bacterium]